MLDTYLKVNQSMYYNRNSTIKTELQANQLLQQAKAQINAMINSKTKHNVVSRVVQLNPIILLKGIAYRKFDTAKEIITSVLEHPSVLEVVRYLEAHEGFKVNYVDVKKDGSINLEHYKELMSDKNELVTCMYEIM
ncbi:aminotransferase class V-fold PLP-dependent enzyme [Staphylococcus aureus]